MHPPTTIGRVRRVEELEAYNHELVIELERVRAAATIDAQTGLPDQRYFADRLDREIHRCSRYDRTLSVAFVEIDDLDLIRARHGDAFTGRITGATASLVCQSLRRSDVVTRHGVGRFGVILPETRLESAYIAIAKILERLRATGKLTGELAEARLSVSAGIAQVPKHEAAAPLVQAAIDALGLAQRRGGNAVALDGASIEPLEDTSD